jgi:trk system potassium uptake protein TrkH
LIFHFRWVAIGDTGVSWWTAVFHSASSFINSGLDIFGAGGLAAYRDDPFIILTTAVLCICGSIGYIVIANVFRRRNLTSISLDSKIVLVAVVILLAVGTLFYLIVEFNQPDTLGPLPLSQKILVAFFQAVIPRSAGFTVIDIGSYQQITLFFTMFLMIIGGAAGSVAGGVKVNTIGTLAVMVISMLRGREHIGAFGRQITRQTLYRAMTLLIIFLLFIGLVLVLLSMTESFPIDRLLFETVSALGTVGLSTGITPELSFAGKFILVFAMFIGRLGPLALVAYLVHHRQQVDLEFPHENIRLG